jgi:hypothetical protein
MRGDSEILVHVNLTEFSNDRPVSGEAYMRPNGQNMGVSSERYCVTEHMAYIDFRAINSYIRCGSFFNVPKM